MITGRHVQLDPLSELTERVVEHLERIYPDEDTHALAKRFVSAMDYGGKIHSAPTHTNLWTERDAVVICYGNSCTAPNEVPLATLARVLHERTEGLFSMVHLLPFSPTALMTASRSSITDKSMKVWVGGKISRVFQTVPADG